MTTVTQEHTLLQELIASRRFLFSQIADLMEEQGKKHRAQAWRWLRDNNKWPGPRKGRYGTRRYGWAISDASLLRCERLGGTTLPKFLVDNGWIVSTPSPTEGKALLRAVQALTTYFRSLEANP